MGYDVMKYKIGIAIPCHKRDILLMLKYPLASLKKLDPPPHAILFCVNEGGYSGLKEIRTKLFDALFVDFECDIVLSACADYLFVNRSLMKEINPDKVTNYGRFLNTPLMGLMWVIARRLVKKPWSSMYSIPKRIWFNNVRDNPLFDGTDSSVSRAVNMDFESNMKINYILMRRNTKRIIQNALSNPVMKERSILKRILKITQGLPI